MTDCIFCRIARKEINADVIYEDDRAMVFKDISPKAPVHLLVIPKKHIEAYRDGFSTIEPEIFASMFAAVESAVKEAGVKDTGYRLIINTGPHSGQEVAHLHMHILGGKPLGGLVGE